MNLKSSNIILLLIFFLALVIRFLYFPNNTYFGFDQARDAYAVREIMGGDLKIVGPPTAAQIIHHGVLYYYIFSPLYFLSGGDPTLVSLFLRVLNSVGIFLVFLIVFPLFGRVVALIAAFLFAVSYEQTQFALFLNHPSLAVISVLIFYLGLSTWLFRKKNWGLLLAIFGLGLSIQFEFVEIQLLGVFILFLLLFKNHLPKITPKNLAISLVVFLIPLSSYVFVEIKNNFRFISIIPSLMLNSAGSNPGSSVSEFIFFINRYFHDNLIASNFLAPILAIAFLIILIKLFILNRSRSQLTFLSFWFFGGLLVYFFINNDGYFYNTGTSIALLIFAAFLISKLHAKSKLLAFSLLFLILLSNMYLITKNNPLGPNQKINPQIGLLLKDQQRVLDFIYQSASGEDFAVNALTMPYNVNTTWSYLFEWYGKKKYGYVPVWGGDAAEGFPGNLKVETARSKLPDKRFLIIEPNEGIPSYLRDSFIANEENYNKTIEKKKIGTMEIWVQQPR